MKRILVSGATGSVGSAVLDHLAMLADSEDVTVLGTARSDASAMALQDRGVTAVPFDFDAPATLRPALDGVDTLFLATGYTVDMLIHAKRTLDAAHDAGVSHIVHLGALAAPDTAHAHFAWHQMIEYTIKAMGFSWTNLHPNFFMDTVWQGLRHRPERLVHFVADRPVSWIAAHDIGAVAAHVLTQPDRWAGQDLPLAAQALTLPDLARLLSRVLGYDVSYSPRPADSLLPIMLKQGMEPAYAAGLATGIAAIEAGQMPESTAVFDTVRTVTGRDALTWQDFATAHRTELPPVTRSG